MNSQAAAAPIGTRMTSALQTRATWAGGTTSTIAVYPAESTSAANARFWVATATIDQPASYSVFQDRVRVHMPIAGNGLRLHFREPDEVITLDRLSQHRFDGARPVEVELLDGPVVAFNLIAQPEVTADAQVVRLASKRSSLSLASVAQKLPAESGTFVRVVYVISGMIELQVEDYLIIRLHPGDAYVFSPRAMPDTLSANVTLLNLSEYSEIVIAALCY